MSKEYTYEEVIELLTELAKEHAETLCGAGSSFPWEVEHELEGKPLTKLPSLYATIYGQVMSVLESTVDKEKLEAAKTVTRQLLQASQVDFHGRMHDQFQDAVYGEKEKSRHHPYKLIAEKVNVNK